MPKIRESYIGNTTLYGLWEIKETSAELEQRIVLTPLERQMLDSFKNETRRQHWLSYRLLIRELLGMHEVDVRYKDSGKPYMNEPRGHLSVSHSGSYSAVIYSPSLRVGIDIERIHEKILRVAHKFVSEKDAAFIAPLFRMQQLVVIWAAKEALYKLIGDTGVDFREHLTVQPFSYAEQGILKAQSTVKGKQESFEMNYEQIDDYIMVYVTA